MLFVALVFGELASHYPVAGALYQYSKFSVGPAYGWFVGWFYGIALLITVAAVDTGVVSYVTALAHNWFGWNLDPTNHLTILVITAGPAGHPDDAEHHRRQVMGRVAQFGVYVEIVGTLGIAIDPGASTASTTGSASCSPPQGVQNAATQPARARLRRQLAHGAALIAVLAPGLHLLRLRVGRRHLRGDQGRRAAGAAGDAPGADLGRRRVVHPDRGAAAGDAAGTTRSARPSNGGGVPFILGRAAERAAGLPAAADHLRVLLLRHLGAGRRQPAGVLLRPRRRAARLGVALEGAPAVPDADQRAARRRRGDGAVRAAGVLLARPGRRTSGSSPTRPTSTPWCRWCRSASAASTCRSC